MTRPAIAGCTLGQIASFTVHSVKEAQQIMDRHYLSRDLRLAEEAIARLESAYLIKAGTEAVDRPVEQNTRSSPG